MSTRSLTAFVTESGVLGRYTHFDGYPAGRIPVLLELLERDGYGTVCATVLGRPGWSSLTPERTDHMLGDRGESVPGYGVAYTEAQYAGFDVPQPTPWENEFGPDSWLEFGYIVHPSGKIEAFSAGDPSTPLTAAEVYDDLYPEDRPAWVRHVVAHYPPADADIVLDLATSDLENTNES